jgi:hypothetical protein
MVLFGSIFNGTIIFYYKSSKYSSKNYGTILGTIGIFGTILGTTLGTTNIIGTTI